MIGCFRRVLNNWVKKTYWYNEVIFKDCRKFWILNEGGIEVVNLGSSSGTYDFNYQGCPIKGSNWALAPQTMVGDFAILKQYGHFLKKNALVIYPLCPFTSISGAVDYVEDRCYTFLDFDNIPNAHFLRKTRMNNLRRDPLACFPLLQIKTELKKKMVGEPTGKRSSVYFDKHAEGMMLSWKNQFELTDLSLPFSGRNKRVFERSVSLLEEMITYCLDAQLKMVIVIPPVNQVLAKKFSSSDRENLIDSFINKANKSRVPYFNMLSEELFSNNDSLFRDSYYFNEEGAKLYTKYLLKKIDNNIKVQEW